MNEENQFLDEFKTDEGKADVLEAPLAPVQEPDGSQDEGDDVDDEDPKNRYQRRLKERLAREREANIALNARLQTIADSQRTRTDEAADYLSQVERIYGTNSPETKEATELLKSALRSVEDRATERALQMFREEEQRREEEVVEARERLESMIEEIEDTTGIAFNQTTQTGFLTMLEKMSPKDSEGNIIEYADHHAVWEAYQASRQARKDTRAKDLAARSMTTSAGSTSSTLSSDSNERWLKEHGII